MYISFVMSKNCRTFALSKRNDNKFFEILREFTTILTIKKN